MKAAGMAYLKRAIELLRTQVLGMAPSPESAAQSQSAVPASQQPRSYTQALLERFQLPQGWPVGSGGANNSNGSNTSAAYGGQDFYNFLASAVAVATGGGSGSATAPTAGDPKTPFQGASADRGVGAFPAGDLTASGTLAPPAMRDDPAAKMTFLAAQRERLSLVLSALDRETATLRAVVASGGAGPGAAADEMEISRPATSASGKSGLSKSRSETDFEKIEAASDVEDNESARPTPAASGGSWMPWGWGGGSSSSSGVGAKEDKSKSE